MVILINNQPAVLKQGTSFDFISENSFFTGADSYSLSISFPLKGCPQNIAIFGHLYRKDCDFTDTILDCEIHDRNFHKYGAVSIVELSDEEVKVQFLEGRSKRNYYTSLDDIYINEIQMRSAWVEVGPYDNPGMYMKTYHQQKEDQQTGEGQYFGFVFMPWVNNTSGNVQNDMVPTTRVPPGTINFKTQEPTIVGFPFLIEVIKQVLDEVNYQLGYTYDLSAIEDSQFADCIVCNALPIPWELRNMNFALPHWSVTEFLEQLELFMCGQFDIDENIGHISFSFNNDILSSQQVVELKDVIDTHTVEVSEKEDTDNTYIEQSNIGYQDCDHQMWKFYCCPWALKQMPVVNWNTMSSMISNLRPYLTNTGDYSHSYYKSLHYCRESDTYFVLNCYDMYESHSGTTRYIRIQPVNMFSPCLYDKREDADMTEMGIVPVCIDDTGDYHGDLVYLECGTYGDDTEEDVNQTQAANTLAAGEKDQKEEYLDKMYVGFWNGAWLNWYPQMPHPIIDPVEIRGSGWHTYDYSLRLHGLFANQARTAIHSIDQSRKYNFQFLADSIPDVRSIFLIHGKKYLAEKITATFSAETGMSSLLKIEAYRLDK